MNSDSGAMSEICRILSPRTDCMPSSCFLATLKSVLAQRAGFQTVQGQEARQRWWNSLMTGRTARGGLTLLRVQQPLTQGAVAGEQQTLLLKWSTSMSALSLLAQMHCFQLEYLLLIIIKFIYLSVLCTDRHIVSHQGLNI